MYSLLNPYLKTGEKCITWPVGPKNIQRYFRTLRERHTAHKRFWGLGPRFSETARRALQDVLFTFFSKNFQIYRSYFKLPFSSFFSGACERRVWLSAESKILTFTFERFRMYRINLKVYISNFIWSQKMGFVSKIRFCLINLILSHKLDFVSKIGFYLKNWTFSHNMAFVP